VQSAAFSSDGQQIVTAGADGTARVWDAQTGQELRRLLGHAGIVRSAAFSPDGQQVVTGSDDRTARVWDARTGQELRRLLGHASNVVSAAFSPPDGQHIVTASMDGTARVWDARTGDGLPLRGHANGVYGAVFSPDGKQVVTASWDHTARVWNLGCELGCSLEKLEEYASSRITRQLTPGERQQFLHEPATREIPASYEQSLAIGQRVAHANPADVQAQRDLAVGYDKLGRVQQADGDLAGARASYEQALAIRQRLAEADPADAQTQADVAKSSNDLCWVGALSDRVSESLPHCERAVALGDGKSYLYRDSRGLARALLGNVPGAIEDFRAFVSLAEEQALYPREVAERRDWVAQLRVHRRRSSTGLGAASREGSRPVGHPRRPPEPGYGRASGAVRMHVLVPRRVAPVYMVSMRVLRFQAPRKTCQPRSVSPTPG
jgi:tetratricopeptide (TPR) repeat protein